MSKFAKLFERDGKQVLVTKEKTDDGEAALQFRFLTNKSEHMIAVMIQFNADPELSEWDVLDREFAKTDEDTAFDIREASPGIGM